MPPDLAHRSSGGSQPSLDLARQRIGAAEHFRRRVLSAFRGSLTAGFSRTGHPRRGRGTGRPPLSRLSRRLSDWQHRSRHYSVRWRVTHRSEGCPTGAVAVSRPCHYRRDRHGRDCRSGCGTTFFHLVDSGVADRCDCCADRRGGRLRCVASAPSRAAGAYRRHPGDRVRYQ
jgi:hypothetical protein